MFRSPVIEVYRMKKFLIGALIAALLLSGCQVLFPAVPASGEAASASSPEATRQATVSPTAVPPTTSPTAASPAATPPDPAARSAVKLKDLIDRFNALESSQWRGYWEEKCQNSKDSADETNAAMLEMTLEDYQTLKAYVLPRIAEYEASQTSLPSTETDPSAPSDETTSPPTEPPAVDAPPPTATDPPTAATDPPQETTSPPTDPPPNPGGGSFLNGYGMLGSINSARQSAGLSAYAWDSSLASIAQTRAMELVQLFSHDRPGGGKVTGQYYECIYYGSGYLGDLSYAFDYWWDSPTHHDIIMETEGDRCYVAGYQSGDYTYWVLLVRPYWN